MPEYDFSCWFREMPSRRGPLVAWSGPGVVCFSVLFTTAGRPLYLGELNLLALFSRGIQV